MPRAQWHPQPPPYQGIPRAAQTIHFDNNNKTFPGLVHNGTHSPPFKADSLDLITSGWIEWWFHRWCKRSVAIKTTQLSHASCSIPFPCLGHIPRAAQMIRCENNNTTFPCLAYNGTHIPYKAGSSDLIPSGWIEWWFHHKRSVATTTTQLSHGSCTMAPTALSRQAARI